MSKREKQLAEKYLNLFDMVKSKNKKEGRTSSFVDNSGNTSSLVESKLDENEKGKDTKPKITLYQIVCKDLEKKNLQMK